jgi:hypothetical protein
MTHLLAGVNTHKCAPAIWDVTAHIMVGPPGSCSVGSCLHRMLSAVTPLMPRWTVRSSSINFSSCNPSLKSAVSTDRRCHCDSGKEPRAGAVREDGSAGGSAPGRSRARVLIPVFWRSAVLSLGAVPWDFYSLVNSEVAIQKEENRWKESPQHSSSSTTAKVTCTMHSATAYFNSVLFTLPGVALL